MRVVEIIARSDKKDKSKKEMGKAGNSTDKKNKSEKENAQQCKIAKENAKRQNPSRIHAIARQHRKDSGL